MRPDTNCAYNEGPGPGGAYWPVDLYGEPGPFWTSSTDPADGWYMLVEFVYAAGFLPARLIGAELPAGVELLPLPRCLRRRLTRR